MRQRLSVVHSGALLFMLCAVANAQTTPAAVPAPQPQLSPQAAYELATRPMEIVRKSVGNWSDSEVASLGVAIKNAAEACRARQVGDFTGDDLIAYAKLCSLGQDWPTMGLAATRYITSDDVLKPQLALAYGLKLEAGLHGQDLKEIMSTARALLRAVPYDAIADSAINEALNYLQLAYTADARDLESLRQPILLTALRNDKPLLPRHTLYADGLSKAALEQYTGMTELAVETVAALDEAAGKQLPPDEAIPMADARRRYELLGKPLPKVTFTLSLYDVHETARINENFGAATALLLFPDWCAQCVRVSASGLMEAVVRASSDDVRLYDLLAEPAPDREALAAEQKRMAAGPTAKRPVAAGVGADGKPRTPAMLLLRTPTLVVPTETLRNFAADDFPFLVVADHAGIVRFAAAAPESVLEPGDFLDRVITHVARSWPRAETGPRSAAGAEAGKPSPRVVQ